MSLIEKIKGLFEAVAPATFADVKTSNGDILRIDGDIAEGSIVSMVGTDGELQVVGAADYTLEDGTVISTDGTGAIIKVVAVEAQMEPAVAEAQAEVEVKEEPVAEKTDGTDKLAELEAKVAELEAAIQMVAEQCKQMMDGGPVAAEMAEVKKENKTLRKQVKELSAEPAAPSVNFKKAEVSDDVKLSKKVKASSEMLNRIEALREKTNK